jgi:hypothetical protein
VAAGAPQKADAVGEQGGFKLVGRIARDSLDTLSVSFALAPTQEELNVRPRPGQRLVTQNLLAAAARYESQPSVSSVRDSAAFDTY